MVKLNKDSLVIEIPTYGTPINDWVRLLKSLTEIANTLAIVDKGHLIHQISEIDQFYYLLENTMPTSDQLSYLLEKEINNGFREFNNKV
ncbi:hypothetical protein AAG747_06485 [Rapidithrix thailandica]|uniref:Uncharacterized protein n=1 Tax=Rapidithrix thailandica TaxID=413964 RepID=A0AAW9RS03_9BACT